MTVLPWRRRRQLVEQAKLDELNRLMSYGGTVSFVGGPALSRAFAALLGAQPPGRLHEQRVVHGP